jgi:hypothetical protein
MIFQLLKIQGNPLLRLPAKTHPMCFTTPEYVQFVLLKED